MIEDLLAQLDLDTKIALISGSGAWTTAAVPAIGLREISVSDGPVGVRGTSRDDWEASAAFPSGSATAASWDVDLLHRLGAALAAEAVRKGVDVVLGPTMNLHRSPLGGRHFECMAEDPHLTGELAAAYVRGLQEAGVGACPKHYVANDAETERMSVDNVLDERTLHELYLAPFETVVADAAPWTIMAAYNGVDGAPMTENDLLAEPLKGSWGFDGLVISDWGAVYDGEATAAAGTDLAMPGPEARYAGLADSVRAGRVPESAIDDKVRRLLLLAQRTGALGDEHPRPPAVDVAALAREAAAAGSVLLTNDGVLPLTGAGRVALVGPGAADIRALGGGSAIVFPPHLVTPVAGLRAAGADVVTAPGCLLAEGLRQVRPDELVGDAVVRWLDAAGELVAEQRAATTNLIRITAEIPAGAVALELVCTFRPDEDGEWQLGVSGAGEHRLTVAGTELLHREHLDAPRDPALLFGTPAQASAGVALRAGEDVEVRLHWAFDPQAFILFGGFAVQGPWAGDDAELARAVELARDADVAVVVVGTSEAVESEGQDRTSLTLPGRQDELVRAVAAVNPRTVVVVNAGSPVELPWRDDVAAVLQFWFPGMEAGAALADVLLGAVEPGGRLPTTWPVVLADAPVTEVVPTDGRLEYTEGLHIGHRGYLRAGTTPAYWFGHGLGYTTWAWEQLTVEGSTATVRLRNTGERAGKQVVQVYAARPDSALDRPVRWLAGFAVVHAGPGEVVDVPVPIGARVLRHRIAGAWAVEPGTVVLSSGPSAGEQLVHADLQL
ncbi:beta-glucosidase [Klenkia soli]|uniref:Beta-glucosidase n=1 Tax=Klenkia soli TaxID=1052260 RepID=A0A1H0L4C7_9ACTN|nr:glycoside hydrolase family 3 C-terminal domain-containing protein [Klenkia soli]SDO62935.1 beta-glucosidase [Klenkia soli]